MRVVGSMAVTPLARSVPLDHLRNATDADLAARLHPEYGAGLARVPTGRRVLRGMPFELGPSGAGPRWLVLDQPMSIELPDTGPASHLVIAHFCDSARGADGTRPTGTPVGWVLPAGEPLATYAVVDRAGTTLTVEVRRRFEINDGIVGWGFLPFAATDHRRDDSVPWQGPHPRQAPGRYAATGHAGPLTTLPGSWGPAQTGVGDHVPSPEGDITLWLHAIPLGDLQDVATLRLTPVADARLGTTVVIAGITLFDGTADPMAVGPRRQILVTGPATAMPDIDLGQMIRSRPVDAPDGDPPGVIRGWGRARGERPAGASSRQVMDLAHAPDARLSFQDWAISACDLDQTRVSPDGRTSIQSLAPPDHRVQVTVRDGMDGGPTPSRVRFVAEDGRYLPPMGHRDEINPGLFEDMGTDVILGRTTYAYVPGVFEIDLPPGTVSLEVVKGFDRRPIVLDVQVAAGTERIDLTLERPIDLRAAGWITADAHVHFLAPSTALLQAAAEDVSIVHLLATQWGDQSTNVNDLGWGSMRDPSGEHLVVVGTENRQNMLGHIGLLGADRPVLPMSSGGAPEGRLGEAVDLLLADWADRCHAAGGLVVASHFPLPFAEIATDIITGRIDAVEMQVFAPGLDNPSISEWYRFLDCGYRLPVLGGTDKMSSEVPVGAVRTYARLDPGAPPTFEAWSAAVRAGRTFATSGPIIELSVDGHEPGDVIELSASGGRLNATVLVRAVQPVIRVVELVVDGAVVASQASPTGSDVLRLDATIEVRSGAWVAARSRSDQQIHSAFDTSMAAHTSPIYVEVEGRPLCKPGAADRILEIVEGTGRWVRDLAAVRRSADRQRMVDLIAGSAELLAARRDAQAVERP